MKRGVIAVLLTGAAAIGLMQTVARGAAEERAPSPQSLETYSIIWERNVFDKDRRAAAPAYDAPPPPPPPEAPAEELRLQGVLITPDEARAFFAGTRPDFNRSAVLGERIGEFEVARVSLDGVVLARDGDEIRLTTSAALRILGGGWRLASPSGGQAVEPLENGGESGGASSMLDRMRARRQEELE